MVCTCHLHHMNASCVRWGGSCQHDATSPTGGLRWGGVDKWLSFQSQAQGTMTHWWHLTQGLDDLRNGRFVISCQRSDDPKSQTRPQASWGPSATSWLQSFTLSTRVHILPTQAEPANPQRPPTSNTKIHTTAKHTHLFRLFTSTVQHVSNFTHITRSVNSWKQQF